MSHAASLSLFARNRLAAAGGVILFAVVLVAVLVPILPLQDRHAQDTATTFLRPFSQCHLLGTDHLGRDILSRLVWGTRLSLVVGLFAGYFVGGTDNSHRYADGLSRHPAGVRNIRSETVTLAHKDLVDAARLSGATLRVFPHNDLTKAESLISGIRRKSGSDPRILIVTESVFSMDGDTCPLAGLVALREKHDTLLLLDEAHAFGVLGETGMGLAEALGLQSRVDFHMGTLSKAAGLSGAYLATSTPRALSA